MRKILIYIEPQPIRNGFIEYLSHAIKIARCISEFDTPGYEFRIFSNIFLLEALKNEHGISPALLIWPSNQESQRMLEMFGAWDKTHREMRKSLVTGQGKISQFYYSVLERIYRDIYKFDGIVVWSDNGAVDKFAKDHKMPVCHMELGTTRSPFNPTIYLDPVGTNGFASVLKAPIHKLEPKITVPRSTWLARKTADEPSADEPGLVDGYLTFNDEYTYRLDDEYLVVPLQTADDLNTVLFSPFSSPADFVSHICSATKNSGLKVLIKGHPAASLLPYNEIKQLEAFEAARRYHHAIVVEGDMRPYEFLNTIVNSHGVISINSSVSFESSLLGRPAFIMGQSAYNLGGIYSLGKRSLNGLTPPSDEELDKVTSFLLCHYMLPDNRGLIPRYFCDFFDLQFEAGHLPLDGDEYWNLWMDRLDYGYRYLTHQPPRIGENPAFPPVLNSSTPNIAQLTSISSSDGFVDLKYVVYRECDLQGIRQEDDLFYLMLDGMRKVEGLTHIFGWSLAKEDKAPPAFLCLVRGSEVVATSKCDFIRDDVLQAFKMPLPARYGFQFMVEDDVQSSPQDYKIYVFSDRHTCQAFPILMEMQG